MMNLNLHRPDDSNFNNNTAVIEKESNKSDALQERKEVSHSLRDQEKRKDTGVKSSDHKSFTDSLKEKVHLNKVSKKEDKNLLVSEKQDIRGKRSLSKNQKNIVKNQDSENEGLKSDLLVWSIATTAIPPTEKAKTLTKDYDDKKVAIKIDKESRQPKELTAFLIEKKEENRPTNITASKISPSLLINKGDTVNSSHNEELPELGEGDTQEPVTLKSELKAVNNDKMAVTVQKNSEPIIIVADRRPITETPVIGNTDQGFSAQLSENLRESGNADIVQRAQIILKEADSGEIRLVLKPDQLGTVRININLEENRILGRIIVDSNMVKAAFDDNMADLRDAMLKSGFLGADLDVSVGGKGHSQQQNQPKNQASLRNSGRSIMTGENNFNSETISLAADTIKGNHRRIDVEA